MARTYGDAITALNSLQTNFATIDAVRKSGKTVNHQSIPEMIEYCRRIGHEPLDLDRLNPIHIAGTKGKGSTSAFISSILAQYLPSSSSPGALGPTKIGLYTSPHLRFVRERINIDNAPLSEEAFTRHFFSTWDALEDASRTAGLPAEEPSKPAYFRFLTLMALHAYMDEKVDSAIIEAGVGGEFDSTNILGHPTVTGITSLGIDHVALLGPTIEDIAWHKAGIMKSGTPAFTSPQPVAALEVLQQRATDKGTTLHVVERHPELDGISLGLAGDFQKTNASLAIAIAATQLRTLGHSSLTTTPLPPEFIRGLQQVHWPGRCETRADTAMPQLTWHIDGGHTLESISAAATWFASCLPTPLSNPTPTRKTPPRILVFNQQTRDAPSLARALHSTLATSLSTAHPFTHVAFCTNMTYTSGGYKPDLISINTNSSDVEELSVQKGLASAWAEIEKGGAGDGQPEGDVGNGADVRVLRTVEEAVAFAREVAGAWEGEGEVKVLVTGSLHLVGGVLEVLEGAKE
ncbi:MAG: Folylpolyglutamate synthetase [Piccolia ochrophora]|nr:MAG: Folylpolyglutamate synthetase [Piccolia ochrophora]